MTNHCPEPAEQDIGAVYYHLISPPPIGFKRYLRLQRLLSRSITTRSNKLAEIAWIGITSAGLGCVLVYFFNPSDTLLILDRGRTTLSGVEAWLIFCLALALMLLDHNLILRRRQNNFLRRLHGAWDGKLRCIEFGEYGIRLAHRDFTLITPWRSVGQIHVEADCCYLLIGQFGQAYTIDAFPTRQAYEEWKDFVLQQQSAARQQA
ncbi:hypothetical protein [Pseudomonas sp. PDM22]|uniref:hypothetical protein n=1 Tax=Pseudomonas sp. PDM22 TaxID=2769287 RepID=UPI0009DAB509|nr:hypothetical protein [Pseudomonas sp. PDM22]MBD9516897.1 hypothetical protein [Pseudomonas sp. PDM22]OQR28631.1 hypothetical protein BWR15_28820 [Pseudomonas sp. T]